MKRKKQYLVLFSVFLLGMSVVIGWRILMVKKNQNDQFSPKDDALSLQPPVAALVGELISIHGEVKKQARGAEEFIEIKEGEEIVDGEKLVTKQESKAEIEFPDFGLLTLGSNTEVSLTSLLPSSFVVNQKQGIVNYELLQEENPFSVRILHLLLNLNIGEVEVTLEDEDITVEQLSGSSKFSLVDKENKTHVWKLEEGQKALIDDSQRRVEIE